MAYAWIQRNYGRDFRPGQRKDPHHVRVVFEGETRPARCHPLSLEVLPDE